MMENKVNANALIEQLIALEYAIRQSIAVREDQEDDADASHLDTAKSYGITVTDDMTGGISKGDLLNAVQTELRKLQTNTRDAANPASGDA
tara:strand:- start:102052 stop:102324 length:273 start_codon:yes stop_codon:yes gene_type:complete